MIFNLEKMLITGIVTILPDKIIKFEDELDQYDFTHKSSLKLQKVMGLSERRVVDSKTTSGDLCLFGLEYVLEKKIITKNEIDALIFVSQTPDHFIPPTSNILQGKLGLGQNVYCIDINQGCAGFLVGLFQANQLLQYDNFNTIVLLNGDTATKQICPKDRNSYPLAGDAGSVTIIRKSDKAEPMKFSLNMDGSRWNSLYIPAGAYREPSTPKTLKVNKTKSGNYRSKEHIHMDGTAIYNFTMKEVPNMIKDILSFSGLDKSDIDYYIFHQPNRFILQRLQKILELEESSFFNNITSLFGNNSSVTIPTVITHNLEKKMLISSYKCCLAAFGVGLTWSSLVGSIGNLDICKTIEYQVSE